MDRAITILEAVAASETPLGVSHLSVSLSIPLATTYRQLQKLTDVGLLIQDATTSQYSLGERSFHLANKVATHRGTDPSRAVLREINEATTFSTLVGKLNGTNFAYIENLPSTSSMSVRGDVGASAPLHATAIGKGVLSLLDKHAYDETVAQLDLHPFSENTITTLDALHEEIELVREQGYAQSRSEYEARVASIAVPFRVEQGPQAGIFALCVAGHTSELSALVSCVEMLRRGAERLGGLM